MGGAVIRVSCLPYHFKCGVVLYGVMFHGIEFHRPTELVLRVVLVQNYFLAMLISFLMFVFLASQVTDNNWSFLWQY
jgi:hypothetical protein